MYMYSTCTLYILNVWQEMAIVSCPAPGTHCEKGLVTNEQIPGSVTFHSRILVMIDQSDFFLHVTVAQLLVHALFGNGIFSYKAWLVCSEFSTLRASVVETDTIVVSRPKVRVLERNASDWVNPTILIQFGSLYWDLTRLIKIIVSHHLVGMLKG